MRMGRHKKPPFAQLFKNARLKHGYSLREVERFTGISNAYINQLETGKVSEPGFSMVVRLSAAYGISIQELLDLVPTMDRVEIQRREIDEQIRILQERRP